MKLCQRCGEAESLRKERYCKDCRKAVLDELKQTGYLQDVQGTSPKCHSVFNEERGRQGLRSTDLLGGSAEWRTDGDNW
jgi:hypothetical protein